jgi:uncharacterized membrane protein YkoI
MNKYWLWIGAGLLTILVLFFGLWKSLSPSADSLSKMEAEKLIETRYKGKVTKVEQEDGQFDIEMVRDDVIYLIKLSLSSGEVLSIDKTGNTRPPTEAPPAEEKPEPPQTEGGNGNGAASRITEDEAVKIALQQVAGTVDDVELETEDSFPYYIVEIDTEDERDTDIQIHAITGEVLSVSWED